MATDNTYVDPDRDEDFRVLQSHVAQLAEHFDTVQVFVTKHTCDGTNLGTRGEGNWFARFGQIKAWIKEEEAVIVQNRISGSY